MLPYIWQVFRLVSCLVIWVGAGAAGAETVTLKSADGTVTLDGTLLDYDGEVYRIDTRFGEMTLNALGVTCAGQACPDAGQYAADISFAAADNLADGLLPSLIEHYAFRSGLEAFREDQGKNWTYFLADSARIPVARIQNRSGNSRSVFAALGKGDADLVLTNRPPLASEVTAASLSVDARHQIFLARDALVFVVAPSNPVSALSVEDLRRIYSGEITNWSELGGDDAAITLYGQVRGTERAAAFDAAIGTETGDREGDSPSAKIARMADRAIADAVAEDPFGIGFTGLGFVRNAKPLAIASECGIRQYPDAFGVKTGDYLLTNPIYLYRPATRLPLVARNFLGWLPSETAQFAIDATGFVSQAFVATPLSHQQYRVSNAIVEADEDVTLEELKRFTTLFANASRLSATFRFRDGSTEMDARSRRDLNRLALSLEQGDFTGRTLIVAGFSDSQGSGDGNRTIALQRAQKFAKMLRKAATRADFSKLDFRVVALGEVAPIACNDTAQGRSLNRRVEIWVE